MSDPYEPSGMSVTLKQDAKDGMWMVFHGSPSKISEMIREAIPEVADVEGGLLDVAMEANTIYKAATTVSSAGGKSLSNRGGGSGWSRKGKVEESATETPAEPEVDPLVEAIEALGNTTDHKQLWAKNRARFDAEPDLLDKWKAKGRALRDAA